MVDESVWNEEVTGKSAATLLPLVYEELRNLAALRLSNESGNQTLSATALVHEVFLRLTNKADRTIQFANKSHFFSVAADAMRRVLIDAARSRNALKRSGQWTLVPMDEGLKPASAPVDLLEFDEVLQKFAEQAPRQSQLLHLRFYGGLTMPEAAEAMGISLATAERDWTFARAWLFDRLNSQ